MGRLHGVSIHYGGPITDEQLEVAVDAYRVAILALRSRHLASAPTAAR